MKLDSSVCLVIELIRSDLDLLPSFKSEADDGTAFWRVESKLSLNTSMMHWFGLHPSEASLFQVLKCGIIPKHLMIIMN